jgi:molybdate transport system substrate-binding protein
VKDKLIKSISLLFIVIIILAGMSGCAQSTQTATSSPAPSTTTTPAGPVELNVSAAASLTDTLTDINALYITKNKNVKITANFAASGTLQKQIEQGAPADVFISAAAKQMQALQDGGLILNETRQNLLNNKIVLVVPSDSKLQINDFMDLLNDDVKQVVIGDPEFVPSGIYGKLALDQLGIYERIKSKLILQIDTPHVLGYVESGNVDAGIVYSTDATLTDKVKIAADAPAEVNNQIVYPIAVIKDSKNAEAAKAYIAFLFSNEAKAIFEKYGFVVVNK